MNRKILPLQVLKAMACIEIIICHSGICAIIGKEGTSIFLVSSGFLFAYNYYDKEIPLSIKSSILFSLNRIKKLYPLYICSILILLPLSALYTKTLITNIKELSIQILLSQSLFKNMDILYGYNGASWYLSCIMYILFLVPLMIVLIQKLKSKRISVIVCILAVVYQAILRKIDIICIYSFPLSRMIDVFIGCNLGYIYIHRKNDDRDDTIKYTIYEIASVIFAIVSTYLAKKHGGVTFTFLPSTLCLVYIFAVNKGYITIMLNNKFLVYFGSLSSYAFLIHMPVIRWVMVFARHIFHIDMNCWILFVVSLFLTILFCEVWRHMEKYIKVGGKPSRY